MISYPHLDAMPHTEADWFDALVALARYLRTPEGCPWDRKQTSRNFAGFLQEEAQELIEAFDEQDNAHIEEEFGDTLFCLLASAVAAEEEGRFKLREALEKAHAKMIRRHGHVFGEHTADTPEEAIAVWQEIKAKERTN
jgi:tetrapyrrole methylase family protein / MazG family protein